MKKILSLAVFAFLSVISAVISANAQSSPGCFSTTISATGDTLIYTNGGASSLNFSGSYTTTGSPASVSISIKTANSTASADRQEKIAALTNTTAAAFSEASGGYRYWYASTATLSSGTIVLGYCMRAVTSQTSTTLVASGSVTGTGAMVLATTPTLITPILGVATGTSLDLTGTADLGVAGTTTGTLAVHNTTSGTITLSPPTSGALGTVTMTVPNMGASSAILASTLTTNTVDAANSIWGASNALLMEGATANGFELTITPADPAIDTTVTIPAIASGAHTLGTTFATFHDQVAADATDRTFFVAPVGVIVDSCSQVHSVAAGGASTIQVTKETTTGAPGAGTDLLTAAFDLNGTANTVQAKTSGDFVSLAARTLAVGDRLSVDYANAIQSSAGIMITCTLIPN